MTKQVTHIVHKLNLEIEAPGEGQARYLYSQAGVIIQQYVLPRLEELLQQYAEEELHIRLETLNIDLQAAPGVSLESVLKGQLACKISEKLEEELQRQETDNWEKEDSIVKKRTGPRQVLEAFFIFLETGILPWWTADTDPFSQSRQIVDAIGQQEEYFIALFLKKVTERPILLERLLLQYDAPLLTYLFSLFAPLEILKTALAFEQRCIERTVPDKELFRQKYWTLIWNLVPVKAIPAITEDVFNTQLEVAIRNAGEAEPMFSRIVAEVLPQAQVPVTNGTLPNVKGKECGSLTKEGLQTAVGIDEQKVIKAKEASRQERKKSDPEQADSTIEESAITADKDHDEEEAQGLLVDNAGLILLHPFLQYFFLELGLLDGEQFGNGKSRDTAVHLLHYLATGKEGAADFELVFEKYLCGLKPKQVTYRYTRLSDKMKTEAETLLSSVIKHWQVLKNTSASGLQESFLQRKGKLIMKEDSHKLIMEHNTLDILLGQLPWNISLVKLPWIKQMVHVEWAV